MLTPELLLSLSVSPTNLNTLLGVSPMEPSLMEACRRSMADSWWACYAASALLTSAYPLMYVIHARRKRSINKHLLDRTATRSFHPTVGSLWCGQCR